MKNLSLHNLAGSADDLPATGAYAIHNSSLLRRSVSAVVLALLATFLVPFTAAPTSAAENSMPTPVYRFYKNDGSHFFTTNEVEKNELTAGPSEYQYEGVAFYSYPAQVAGTSPVYRFYDTRSGVHFYTISETERQALIASASSYRFEGVAYFASTASTNEDRPVYRFYKFAQGVHFYTDNPGEAASLRSTASSVYRDEGIAYFVPARLTFSGSGATLTDPFVLPSGLSTFRFSSIADTPFKVALSTSDFADYLISKPGATEGSTSIGLGEGSYLLKVETEGPWTITIEQPKASAGSQSRFDGIGSQTTELFALEEGAKEFYYSSEGDYFYATLLDATGSVVDVLTFESGPSVSVAYTLTARGLYVLNIFSDGPWSVRIG